MYFILHLKVSLAFTLINSHLLIYYTEQLSKKSICIHNYENNWYTQDKLVGMFFRVSVINILISVNMTWNPCVKIPVHINNTSYMYHIPSQTQVTTNLYRFVIPNIKYEINSLWCFVQAFAVFRRRCSFCSVIRCLYNQKCSLFPCL